MARRPGNLNIFWKLELGIWNFQLMVRFFHGEQNEPANFSATLSCQCPELNFSRHLLGVSRVFTPDAAHGTSHATTLPSPL